MTIRILLLCSFLLSGCDFSLKVMFGGATEDVYDNGPTADSYDSSKECRLELDDSDDHGCRVPKQLDVSYFYTVDNELKILKSTNWLMLEGVVYQSKGGKIGELECVKKIGKRLDETSFEYISCSGEKVSSKSESHDSDKVQIFELTLVNEECGSWAKFVRRSDLESMSRCESNLKLDHQIWIMPNLWINEMEELENGH